MDGSWEDKYLLNIDKIDQQHRVFFELWDKEMKQADLEDHLQMATVIEKLENYLKEHFKYEIELLRKSNYEEINNHIEQHNFFIQKVNNLKQELNYNNPLLFEKTALFMKKWFLNHIIQSDRKYQDITLKYLKHK